ncbi:MAG: hypothetical protein EOO88_40390 [Pedobacter sp.]|nr:MAG: hypothetical protein EOO88_40390 [Pedobacter sp.]
MNKKISIRKVMTVAIWLLVGGGMLTLLIAAMDRQQSDTCKDYVVSIKAKPDANLFLGEKDLVKLLSAAMNGPLKGQAKSSFKLQQMEQLLRDNDWVNEAELYFDNKDVLHIEVTEREPIARVFTVSGQSFYIDRTGRQLPLSDRWTARLPVFTSYPDRKVMANKDSLLLNDVVTTAEFIANDPFWMAQVSQVDIQRLSAKSWNFMMTPLVGNHLVKLGDGKEINRKFKRLYLFYKNVLAQRGFNSYKTVDVSFAGQVIGVKGETSKVDSVQLRKNVEALLKQSRETNALMEVMPVVSPTPATLTPNAALGEESTQGVMSNPGDTVSMPRKPAAPVTTVKPTSSTTPKPVLQPKPKGNDKAPQKGATPKATMPKRN